MTNFELTQVLEQVKKFDDLIGAEFIMALDENLDLMTDKVKHLNKIKEQTAKYKLVIDKMTEKFKEYADKDERGNFTIPKNAAGEDILTIKDTKQLEAFKTEQTKLIEDNIEDINIQEEKNQEYNRILTEECGIVFKKVPKTLVPKNISLEAYKLLKTFMIEK